MLTEPGLRSVRVKVNWKTEPYLNSMIQLALNLLSGLGICGDNWRFGG